MWAGTHGHIPRLQGDAYLPWKHGAPVPGPPMLQAPEGTLDCTQALFIITSRTLRDHVSPCKPLDTLQLWGRLEGGWVPKPQDYFYHTHRALRTPIEALGEHSGARPSRA